MFRNRRHGKRDDASSNSSSFFIPDSSPMMSYGIEGSPMSPWTAGYAVQSDGYDETFHLTIESNSLVSFNMTATSFALLIPPFVGCAATLTINGSAPVAACATKSTSGLNIPFSLYSLPGGLHHIEWNSGIVPPGEEVIFWGVDAFRPADASTIVNVTFDDTYDRPGAVVMSYQGAWQSLDKGATSNLTEMASLSTYLNSTLSVTDHKGASMSFSGKGSAAYIFGIVGPMYGSASVSLNGDLVALFLNLTSPWPLSYELLWYQTGLDVTQRQNITLTNLVDADMSVDFVILTTGPDILRDLGIVDSTTGFLGRLSGKIVVYLIVPLVIVHLLAFILGSVYIRRRKRRRSAQTPYQSWSEPSRQVYLGTTENRVSEFSLDSRQSDDSNIFVCYDGTTNRSPTGRRGTPASPPAHDLRSSPDRPARPVPPFDPDSDPDTPSSNKSWSLRGGIASLLGSFMRTNHDARRDTDFPAYTFADSSIYYSKYSNDTADTKSAVEDHFQPNARGKPSMSNLQLLEAGPSQVADGRSMQDATRASTLATSDITSVSGQPPSDTRMSAGTATYPITPIYRPSPTVVTSFPTCQDRQSNHSSRPSDGAYSLLPYGSMSPPSTFTHRLGEWPPTAGSTASQPRSPRGMSIGGLSLKSGRSDGAGSAARPDSDIIPHFGSSVASLSQIERPRPI